jgi:Cytochrome P450
LTNEQVQQFYDYNSALLSLSKNSKQYKKGSAALEGLSEEMLRRFRIMEKDASGDDAGSEYSPARYVFEVFQNQDGYLNVGNYERISIGMLLMIWGAYVESAGLMVDSAVSMLEQKIDPSVTVLQEMRDLEARGLRRTDLAFWDGMKFTTGILRETMRLVPPGAGVQRYGEVDFSLGGYRIPAGMSVVMDPRIGNKDPNLYERAGDFEPMRWVPEGYTSTAVAASPSCPFKGTALKLGPGSWFPGGNGAHRCPGVPLAELVSTMFLASLSERFQSWEFGGSGLNKDGTVNYVEIPIKICPDDLGLKFALRKS